MINLGYMSSLRLGPGSALGEKLELKVHFVNQKKKKKKMGARRKLSLKRGKGLQGLGLGKGGGGSAALPSSPVHCSTRFTRLDSFSCLTSFLPPPPPPAEPSPKLEPSSGNSNFVYQSPTFSKDPFFSSYINFKLKRSFLTKTPMLIN